MKKPPHFRFRPPFSFAAFAFLLVFAACSSGDVVFMQSSPYPSQYELLASERIAELRASSLRHGMNPLLEEASARRNLAATNSTWQTLTGSPPLVVSRGDNGLLPDQTLFAYLSAKAYGLSDSSALLCDVQITSDRLLICRTGIDLGLSTDINFTFPELYTQLDVNGETLSGFFSINITIQQAQINLTAIQANQARPNDYSSGILSPYDVYNQIGGPLWINVEYPSFYSQNGFNVGSAITSVPNITIAFLSSPEVVFLKDVQGILANTTRFVLKFRGKNDTEPSTKQSYGSLLSNLTSISAYASGILVPKDYIWSVNNESGLLVSESTLISDAHAANLAIYAYDFVNELNDPSIYNYSFNPILEYLQYAPSIGPNVDGFFTDFPITASKALACYRSIPSVNQTEKQTLVISHGGASGDYPDCTTLAYEGAVKGGADFIDCPIQITQDGVPICRGSINLLTNTDITTSNGALVATRTSTFPQLSDSSGVYTFNLTWSEIQTLKATIDNSDIALFPVSLNKEYDGQQNILNFTEFLNYAKTQSVNILVDIQYGYILETEIGVDVVTPVLSALSDAGLENSSRVVIQSEDSAILKRVRETNNYTLAFRVTETNVTITEAVVSEIKALATYATLQRGLIQPTFDAYLLNSTGVVELFHNANMSVFVYYLRNVFVKLPNDYESDPTAEIDTMVKYFNVDGIITTFPATAKAYLGNGCLDLKTEIGGLEYQPNTIQPGAYLTQLLPRLYPASAPGPLFDVNKNQTTLPLTVNTAPSTSPRPSPSASSSLTGKNNAAHLHVSSTHTSLLILAIIAFQYLVC